MTSCRDCVASALRACRGDYCRAERIGLVEEAERRATAMGHTLGDFTQARRQPVWRAHCERCGLEIGYTIDPDPGEPMVFGAGLETACTTGAGSGAEVP